MPLFGPQSAARSQLEHYLGNACCHCFGSLSKPWSLASSFNLSVISSNFRYLRFNRFPEIIAKRINAAPRHSIADPCSRCSMSIGRILSRVGDHVWTIQKMPGEQSGNKKESRITIAASRIENFFPESLRQTTLSSPTSRRNVKLASLPIISIIPFSSVMCRVFGGVESEFGNAVFDCFITRSYGEPFMEIGKPFLLASSTQCFTSSQSFSNIPSASSAIRRSHSNRRFLSAIRLSIQSDPGILF